MLRLAKQAQSKPSETHYPKDNLNIVLSYRSTFLLMLFSKVNLFFLQHWLLMRQGNTLWNHEIISEKRQRAVFTSRNTAPVCSVSTI